MGFLKNIFGRSSPENDMYRLLTGPAEEMANEMERVYRNQVSSIPETSNNTVPSARGILKARLFGITFMVFAFGTKWQNEAALNEMMNASSGLAMKPFGNTAYQPQINREEAASFSGDYMMEVFRAIASEIRDGPSTPMNRTSGFATLVTLYESAIKESVGCTRLTPSAREQLFPMVAGAIHANLKHMTNWMEGL